ncbi:MAG: DUF1080 domain-containing protein [Planctomycetota bacterium]|nr:DUF1080 domain-containing protein [Planctomycetota bacterium]MDA1105634.1 DUF1080 domain-containing protein [Planctomycetota bacterium]
MHDRTHPNQVSLISSAPLCAALLGVGFLASAPNPSLAPEPVAAVAPSRGATTTGTTGTTADWVDLFNGKDLSAWKVFPQPKDPAANPWTVLDGVLSCAGQPVGYIQTEKTYESFELELDWRFDPAKGAGNSGVLLRVVGEDQVWPNSMEAQLHSENAGDIWNIGEFPARMDAARTQGRRTVKNYDTNEKPLGEWNHYKIVFDGPTLMLFVNGTLQNVATHCEVVPGRLALQSEGAHIQFRNIRLKELPSPSR